MRSPADRRRLASGPLVALLLLLVPLPASAETTQSDLVLIRQDDVVTEDLYAAGNQIQIAGRIEGDLVASAFGEIRIDGTVEGDVTVIASRLVIAGVVEGSVRVLAPEVVIEGTVGEDLVVAARLLSTAATAAIGRDVVTTAWRMELAGGVGRGVEGFIRSATLEAGVAGDVEIDVQALTVTDTARVGGDLTYRSANEAVIDGAASIGGSVLERAPLSPNVRVLGLGLLVRLLLVVFGAGLGLSMVWAATQRSAESAAVLTRRPLASLGQGMAVVALPVLLVAGVLGVASVMSPEAALPLVAVALPFVLALIGVLVLAALVSPVPPAVLIGSRIRPERTVYAQFLIGFVVIVLLIALPIVGRFVLLAVVVAGIGGWLTRVDEPTE